MFEKGDWVVLNGQAKKLLDPDQISALNTFEGMLVLYATKAEIRVALAEEFALFASDFYEEWSNAATRKGMTSLYNRVKSLLGEVEKGA